MDLILSGNTKFERINEDYWKLINKLEKKLNKCFLKLYYNSQLDQKTYEHLCASVTNL